MNSGEVAFLEANKGHILLDDSITVLTQLIHI